jgi:hypothetical protein
MKNELKGGGAERKGITGGTYHLNFENVYKLVSSEVLTEELRKIRHRVDW